MSSLFSPLKIKDLEIRNRIVMAPMCINSASTSGVASESSYIHYVTRAIGGVGLIIVEATAVEARGRIRGNDLGLWDDTQIEGLKKITNQVKAYGAKIGIQLAHAGRKCEVEGEDIIAPSILEDERFRKPNEMTLGDIKDVILAFKKAASRALEAGFDLIEIHAAHGYLLNQFLSPLTNKRTDEYGGGFENRIRLLKEVILAIKGVWPSTHPLGIRFSATEYHPEGHGVEETIEVINELKDLGIDLIDVSSGGVVVAPIKTYPGYQIDFAEEIKIQTGILTMGGGLLNDPFMMDDIIKQGRVDLIYLGKELLTNPYWSLQASIQLKADFKWPQYDFLKKR